METPQLSHANTTLFDRADNFVDINRLFYSYFSIIANKKELGGIDATKVRKWLSKDWTDKIVHTYSHRQWSLSLIHISEPTRPY